jgi:branched-chain amino acid transport system permease protein
MGGAVFAAALYQGPLYFQNVVTSVFQPGEAPGSFGPAISPLVSSFDPVPFLLYTLDSVRQLQLVVMGVVLIWLMHNRPEGMLGHRKETAAAIPLGRPGGGGGGGSSPDSGSEPATRADGDGTGGAADE